MRAHLKTTVPDLSGRIALVTGATSGIGLATAERLAAAGAETILAVRDVAKARRVVARLRKADHEAAYRIEQVDLADLASVRACAARIVDQGRPLDIMINNAGVRTGSRRRETTGDGFELHLGTNFLGPFALTGLLLPVLRHSYAARVVQVGSLTARNGRLDLDTPRRYSSAAAYAGSKLALTTFGVELQRRSIAQDWGVTSVVAHPGWSATGLRGGRFSRLRSVPLMSQPEIGALPLLVAATRPEVRGGTCIGPTGGLQMMGVPGMVPMPKRALDAEAATRLWRAAEDLTAVAWPMG